MSTQLLAAADAFFAYEWAYCATIEGADTEERYALRDQLRHEIAASECTRRALRDLLHAWDELAGWGVVPAPEVAAARAVLSEQPGGRVMDARTEAQTDARATAAAYVLCRRGALSRAPYDLAVDMLAEADAVEAPLAEQLATALRPIVEREPMIYGGDQFADHKRIYGAAKDALAVFDAARVDSQGTPTKEET